MNDKVLSRLVGPIGIEWQQEAWIFNPQLDTVTDDVEELILSLQRQSLTAGAEIKVVFSLPKLDAETIWIPRNAGPRNILADWQGEWQSEFAIGMPIFSLIAPSDQNVLTASASEVLYKVKYSAGLHEEDCFIRCAFIFYADGEAPRGDYTLRIRLNRDRSHFARALESAGNWYQNLFLNDQPAPPREAFDAVYSTWYSYHQGFTAAEIIEECKESRQFGLSTVILDDGWQTDDRSRGYAFCGDWNPSARFGDFADFIRALHQTGMKVMLWFSMPFVGFESDNYRKFNGKYLQTLQDQKASVLDPRFPEVRDFIVQTYVRAIREWDLDGLKLDFINNFQIDPAGDPAVETDYAGRDYKSVPEALSELLRMIQSKLLNIKSDLLFEFRQSYIGPACQTLGNMFRAGDCPGSLILNRTKTVDLRLTTCQGAVHSDMIEWHEEASVESAARQVLSVLFSVPQISVRLKKIPAEHRTMLKFWMDFMREHREVLLYGDFTPSRPDLGYPMIMARNALETIAALYSSGQWIKCDDSTPEWYIINAGAGDEIIVELVAAPAQIEIRNTLGNVCWSGEAAEKGLYKFTVPASGLLHLYIGV